MDEPTPEQETRTGAYSLAATFSSLAHTDRRRLVGYLREVASEPVSRAGLAAALAAHTHEKPIDAVTEDERHDATIALHHQHLPSLTAADLVERNADDTIALADHPAFQDPGIVEAVEGSAPASAASLDDLFDALADARRRTILDVLSHQFGAIHVETVARELEARAQDTAESDVPTDDVEAAMKRLHHVDLPHLSEAGLVEYDVAADTVEYIGHPVLSVPWMHSVLHPDFLGSLTDESEPSGIGEIAGRERVVSFGQSVLESADEELFCMFTDTQLLKAGCLTRIRDAARERDVDVYLGTRDPAVKQYIRENAPEVILWEPDTNWLNLPVTGDRVGRLLMADREAVMLGTLLEETTDGLHEEEAIVGNDEHNTLVTMICQLLTPHLEQIDSDTENVETRIPL